MTVGQHLQRGITGTPQWKISSPVLRTVIDMQNFDGVSFHGIDYDIRERRQREFSCATSVAGPASVGEGFQKADTLIDCPHGRFCKMRVVLLQIVLDVLEIVSGGDCPTDAHQVLRVQALRLLGLEHGFKAGVHFFFFDKLATLGRR